METDGSTNTWMPVLLRVSAPVVEQQTAILSPTALVVAFPTLFPTLLHLGTTTPNPNYPSWGEIGSMGVVTPGLVVLGSLVPTGTKPTTNQRAGSLPPRQTRARRGRRAELCNQLVALLVLIGYLQYSCILSRTQHYVTYVHVV